MNPDDPSSMDIGSDPRQDPAYMGPRGRPSQGGVTLSQEQFESLLSRLAPQPAQPDYDYADAIGQDITEGPVQQEPAADPIEAMLANLPAPQQDFDGFKKGLAGVLAGGRDMILNEARQTSGQMAQVNRSFDDAWGDFKERYPELSQYEDLVADASRREFDDLRSRNLDPSLVVSRNLEGFVDSIANRVQTTVNKVRGLKAEDHMDVSNDYDRTEMVGGGNPGRKVPGKDNRSDVPSSLVDDLRKVQRELGIY